MAENVVTVQDGGTAALAGLTENRSKVKESRVPGFSNLPLIGGLFRHTSDDKATREIAVFVTAHLVPETSRAAYRPGPATAPSSMELTDEEYQLRLREALSRQ
jgi:type II secretory pathway component GspD/PulD (secretin)